MRAVLNPPACTTMSAHNQPNSNDSRQPIKVVSYYLRRHALKIASLAVLLYVLLQKDLSIDLYLNTASAHSFDYYDDYPVQKVTWTEAAPAEPPAKHNPRRKDEDNLANSFSNMTFSEAPAATPDAAARREAKRQKQEAYVKRFARIAQDEAKRTGMPASVILAQGLLESDAGESKLALENYNHFGIKCFSRSCSKGHCSNFTDDSHKDFFRIYRSPTESYRAHSQLLKGDRYKHLFLLGKHDYKGWATGLQEAGYATDPGYGGKLIHMIEDLALYKYDR